MFMAILSTNTLSYSEQAVQVVCYMHGKLFIDSILLFCQVLLTAGDEGEALWCATVSD